MINNVLLQHGLPFTTVESGLQPHSKAMALTLVSMDKRLPTLADRLRDAMKESGISASDLARACNVSPAAVSKWLDGQTKELKASNYIDAARALGVREEWLRTGKLPRERDAADQEERAAERVLSLLEDLRDPLTALVKALDEISTLRKPTTKKRRA